MIKDHDIWFPNIIWSGEITDLNNTVLKEYSLEKIAQKNKEQLLPDDRPWDSTDVYLEECTEVEKLVAKLDKCMKDICNDVGFAGVRLYNIWVNRNPPGVENVLHNHLHHGGQMGALFSGVWYLEADETLDQGDTVFERNDSSEMHIPQILVTESTPYNIPRAQYKSKTNNLLIFSSWIPHRVTKNNSNKDRFSISFNYGV